MEEWFAESDITFFMISKMYPKKSLPLLLFHDGKFFLTWAVKTDTKLFWYYYSNMLLNYLINKYYMIHAIKIDYHTGMK